MIATDDTELATEQNFDAERYLANNQDVRRFVLAGGSARQHFLDHGRGEGRRQLSEEAFATRRGVGLVPGPAEIGALLDERGAGDGPPSEFDPIVYRKANPDIASLDDARAAAHYRRTGRAEGRIASLAATREGFLACVVERQAGAVLEIGPFCRPLVRGPHVRYLDMLDSDALRARAVQIGLDPSDCPETIHYIGDLKAIEERFSAVLSSHAIEHQPDLVGHLIAVARLLDKGGRYLLIVPDKRYCFDALIPESTIAQVLQAHHEGRSVHSLQSVIEHRALTVHNDGVLHWQRDHGPIPPQERAKRIRAALDEYEAAQGGYIDVHAWYWTPKSFRTIVNDLFALDLIPLRATRVYDTPRDRFEFCAVLEKRGN